MRSFYFPCASVFEVATLVHSCCLNCTSVTEQGWNIGPWKILLYCQNKWENVSKPPITYNRLQKAKQNHARKRLLRTKWRKEREGYTFSLPASTKITKKKSILRIYRRALSTTEQPPTLDCSRETKACMGNHGMRIHDLNRGCGVVPSTVTAVLWRNLVSSLVQPEWTMAQRAISHIQHPYSFASSLDYRKQCSCQILVGQYSARYDLEGVDNDH